MEPQSPRPPETPSYEELLERVARLERLLLEKDRRIAELERLLEQSRRGGKLQAAPDTETVCESCPCSTSSFSIVDRFGHLENLLPLDNRFVRLPRPVERLCELQRGAIVSSIPLQHLPESDDRIGRIVALVQRVETSPHQRLQL